MSDGKNYNVLTAENGVPVTLRQVVGVKGRGRYENEKGGGPGRPASLQSPLGESGQSDGGRPAGRVLACLYNPGILKKVPGKPKKSD
jgi:hypothetical protein